MRHALRLLARQPGFTSIAVLTIAIAIGACTALFSVMNAVVLRPLDFPEPDRLVRLWARNAERNIDAPVVGWPKWELIRDQQTSFAQLAISVQGSATITDGVEPEQVPTLQASADFLPLLGLAPQLGRVYTVDEDREGAPAVALISHRLWETRFNRDPNLLGRTLTLDGVPTDIIGVLPARLPVPFNTVDIIQPRPFEVSFLSAQARLQAGVWQVTGRLKPGVTRERAEQQLLQLHERFKETHPRHLDASNVPRLRLLADEVHGNLGATFWLLAGAVAAVLLIACANITNLTLARLSARQKEIAVRASLGASRGTIVRQFLLESLLIAIAGGVLGVLVASWGLEGIRVLAGTQLPRAGDIALDGTVLFFATAITVLTTVLVGLYPAIEASRTNVQIVLKDAGRGSTGSATGHNFRNLLVVAEVALSLVLLVCAGLLILTFLNLQHTPLGFTPDRVAAGNVNLPQNKYGSPELSREFYRQVQEKLASAPELAAGGATSVMPLTQAAQFTAFAVHGRPIPPIPERPIAGIRTVTDGYFQAMSMQLREGRFFTPDDRPLPPGENGAPSTATGACVVNEQLAQKLFPGESALGQTLLFGVNGEAKSEIIGILRNVKTAGVSQPIPDEIYFPRTQRGGNFMTLVGRARPGLDASVVPAVLRRIVAEVDPAVALAAPAIADDLVRQSVAVQRLTMTLLMGFAGIAALLASVGIYSVMAYTVSQRTSEIGVRMALGATTGNILRLVLRGAAVQIGLGLVLGLGGAFAASRLLQESLYEVKPFDPTVFTVVAGTFALVATLACLVPARRAARVDPMTALRAE